MTEHCEFFLVARVGPSDRLIELSTVREIVPSMQLATPTGVARGCRGIANVRGEVVPVFDLMHRAGELETSQLIVIAHRSSPHGTIGIVVDDVLELIELPAARVVTHPAGLGRQVRSANLNGQTLTVLGVNEVIDAA
jgi:purine-binding chemotaxis protein CheW